MRIRLWQFRLRFLMIAVALIAVALATGYPARAWRHFTSVRSYADHLDRLAVSYRMQASRYRDCVATQPPGGTAYCDNACIHYSGTSSAGSAAAALRTTEKAHQVVAGGYERAAAVLRAGALRFRLKSIGWPGTERLGGGDEWDDAQRIVVHYQCNTY